MAIGAAVLVAALGHADVTVPGLVAVALLAGLAGAAFGTAAYRRGVRRTMRRAVRRAALAPASV